MSKLCTFAFRCGVRDVPRCQFHVDTGLLRISVSHKVYEGVIRRYGNARVQLRTKEAVFGTCMGFGHHRFLRTVLPHDTSAATNCQRLTARVKDLAVVHLLRFKFSSLSHSNFTKSAGTHPPCQLTSPLQSSAFRSLQAQNKTKDQDEVPTSSLSPQQQQWRQLRQQLSCCSLVRQGRQQPHQLKQRRHVLGPAPGGSAGRAASLAAARAAGTGAAAQAGRSGRDAPPQRRTLGRSAWLVRMVTRQVASLHNLDALDQKVSFPRVEGKRTERRLAARWRP
jgi:hypothetical protein